MKFTKAARPVILGANGMVSCGHHLAALTGVNILGAGGDLFALVYMKKTGKVEAINSSGPAPAKASIDYFRELGLKAIPQSGALSIAVPGAVDGWLELHKKYATK